MALKKIREKIEVLHKQDQEQELQFNEIFHNCSTFVYDILAEIGVIDFPKPFFYTPQKVFAMLDEREEVLYHAKIENLLSPSQS